MKQIWTTQGFPFKCTGLTVQYERQNQQFFFLMEIKNISYTDEYLRRHGAADNSTIDMAKNGYKTLEA